MVDAKSIGVALGGGLLAAEATGVTNIVGGGGSAVPGMGRLIPIPGGGGGGGETTIDFPEIPGVGSGAGSVTDEFSDTVSELVTSQNREMASLLKEMNNLEEEVNQTVSDTTDTAGTVTDFFGGYPGPGTNPFRWGSNQPGPGPSPGEGKDPESAYSLQTDYTGPFSGTVRGGAEIFDETGDTLGGVLNFSERSGRTVGQAGRLLGTGTANTRGTFQSGRGKIQLPGGQDIFALGKDVAKDVSSVDDVANSVSGGISGVFGIGGGKNNQGRNRTENQREKSGGASGRVEQKIKDRVSVRSGGSKPTTSDASPVNVGGAGSGGSLSDVIGL